MTHDEILFQLPAMLRDGMFRYRLVQTLRRSGIRFDDRCAETACRRHLAAQLLASGMSRSDARQALQERLGVSRRTAYYLLAHCRIAAVAGRDERT